MRSNEEKSYLVLQHLYEMFTEKDPTNMDPYKMELEILKALDSIAEEVAKNLLTRFEKEFGNDPSEEECKKILAALTAMKDKSE